MTASRWLNRTKKSLGIQSSASIDAPRGILVGLARDTRAATLPLMAAAMIPLVAMIGGAVDMSRFYLVKTRLQQACDAGALAARRTMTTTALDDESHEQGQNFFKLNLREGIYGADDVTLTLHDVNDAGEVVSPDDAIGKVGGTAVAKVPTTMMRVFNYDEVEMTAECEARLEVSNNDIMFVLDVTGSMAGSRIEGLKTAVVDFYDAIAEATSEESRLRIGFVPYSSSVNLGSVGMTGGILPLQYITDTTPYQTRRRVKLSDVTTTNNGNWTTISSSATAWTQHSSQANRTSGQCSSVTVPNSTTTYGPETTVVTTTNGANDSVTTTTTRTRTATIVQYQRVWGVTDTSGNTRDCVIQRRTVTEQQRDVDSVTVTPDYTWRYEQWPMATDQYKLGIPVTTLTANNYTNRTSTWNGCIEERKTVWDANFSSPLPISGVYDLDIDGVPDTSGAPNSDDTKWKPAWPSIIYDRSSMAAQQTDNNNSQPTGSAAACPKRARKLAEMTRTEVYNYVNASDFVAIGGTYHDVGMIWGARLISPTGIFASENALAPNGKPVNRHIIFMTDGEMAPTTSIYSLYGWEKWDRRISGVANTPTNSNLTTRHNARFLAVCDFAKRQMITVWVVAYGDAITAEQTACATPGKALSAATPEQLTEQFERIASQIAELRLSK